MLTLHCSDITILSVALAVGESSLLHQHQNATSNPHTGLCDSPWCSQGCSVWVSIHEDSWILGCDWKSRTFTLAPYNTRGQVVFWKSNCWRSVYGSFFLSRQRRFCQAILTNTSETVTNRQGQAPLEAGLWPLAGGNGLIIPLASFD